MGSSGFEFEEKNYWWKSNTYWNRERDAESSETYRSSQDSRYWLILKNNKFYHLNVISGFCITKHKIKIHNHTKKTFQLQRWCSNNLKYFEGSRGTRFHRLFMWLDLHWTKWRTKNWIYQGFCWVSRR